MCNCLSGRETSIASLIVYTATLAGLVCLIFCMLVFKSICTMYIAHDDFDSCESELMPVMYS